MGHERMSTVDWWNGPNHGPTDKTISNNLIDWTRLETRGVTVITVHMLEASATTPSNSIVAEFGHSMLFRLHFCLLYTVYHYDFTVTVTVVMSLSQSHSHSHSNCLTITATDTDTADTVLILLTLILMRLTDTDTTVVTVVFEALGEQRHPATSSGSLSFCTSKISGNQQDDFHESSS